MLLLLIVFLFLVSFVLPLVNDQPSLFLERIDDWVVEMVAELPYSRLLENEADAIGLEIAAAACYDSTHASEFWKRHALAHEVEDKNVKKVNEYLSTHPLSSNRSEIIANRTHEMQQLSEDCGCGSKLKKKLLYSLTRHARK
jgi:predicted Zn-dependent protease